MTTNQNQLRGTTSQLMIHFAANPEENAIKGTLHMWLIARSCASTQGTDRAVDHFGQKLALNEKREAALECHKAQHWSDIYLTEPSATVRYKLTSIYCGFVVHLLLIIRLIVYYAEAAQHIQTKHETWT